MSFKSIVHPGERVITDANYREFFNVKHADGSTCGRGRVQKPRDWKKPRCLSRSAVPIMTEREICERAIDLEKKRARLSDFARDNAIPCEDQDGTNYCWINAPTHCVALKRVLAGHAYVRLSPASVGGPLTSFRNVGGWGTNGLKGIAERGLVPADRWPVNAIDRRFDTADNRALAAHFRAEEWDELETTVLAVATQLVLLNPVAIGLDWWSHVVTYYDVLVENMRIAGFRFRNSWGMSYGDTGFSVLTGSKMVPDDAVTPRAITPYDYSQAPQL